MKTIRLTLIALALLTLVVTACGVDPAVQAAPTNWAAVQQVDVIATSAAIATQRGVQTQAVQATAVQLILDGNNAQATAQAAQYTAEAFGALQTGTVQAYAAQQTVTAQSAQGTSTAQAWQVTVAAAQARETQQAQATAQAWAATATADAQLSTATAVASATQAAWTQTALDLASTAEAGLINSNQQILDAQAGVAQEQLAQERIQTEKADYSKYAQVYALFALGIAATLLVAWVVVQLVRTRAYYRDEQGGLPILTIDNKVVNPERSLFDVINPERPLLAPVATQARMVDAQQKVDLVRGLPEGQPTSKVAAVLAEGTAPAVVSSAQGNLPEAAPWELFKTHQGPEIPLGLGETGQPMLLDPELEPHRLFAGKTGAGKDRSGMRPFIAGALGRGWQVAAIDLEAPVDFKVFEGHPNFHAITVQEPEDVLWYLEAVLVEVRRRWGVLYQENISRWSQHQGDGPRLAVVVDEFAALVDELAGPERVRFTKVSANISRLGRKAGIHMVAGAQNPTKDNIHPNIRRNMTAVAFRVVDQIASRVILEQAGAETLLPGQYMVRLNQEIQRGVGFAPGDDEVREYLNTHRAAALAVPGFLMAAPQERPQVDEETRKRAEKIRDAWMGGTSKRGMARLLGEEYAGAFCAKLDAAIEYLRATTATEPGGDDDEAAE